MSEEALRSRPRYATMTHPTIAAVVRGQFRFAERAQAVKRLSAVRAHFIAARSDEEGATEDAPVKLWIRGFFLTEEEEKKGYLGHYATLSIHQRKDDKFTLIAEKIDVPLKNHPQKKRLSQRHPNWGHPVLRAVKNGCIYDSVEAAQLALDQLHEEYPEVTIPNGPMLYVITYGRAFGGESPIQKFILEIKARPEGCCVIASRENKKTFQPKVADAALVEDEMKTSRDASKKPEKMGYYTAMVEIKRKKKSIAKSSLKRTEKKEEDEN